MALSVEAELEQIDASLKGKDADALVTTAISRGGAIRQRAAQALKALGKKGIGRLSEALSDEHPAARARAALSLGEVGDKASGKLLKPLLSDDSPSVRAAAAEAIALVGDKGPAKEILALLKTDTEADVRRAAIFALQIFGDAKAAADIEGALNDSRPLVRRAAIRALIALDKAPLDTIALRLNDADESVRVAAASAFEKKPSKAHLKLLVEHMDDRSETVRLTLSRALVAISAKELDEQLGPLLDDRSPHVRCVLLEAIRDRKPANALEPMLDIIREAPEPAVRIAAAQALGALGDPRAVERLTLLLLHEDPAMEAAAEKALQQILGKGTDTNELRADGNISLERWEQIPELGRAALAPLVRTLDQATPNSLSVTARCAAARTLGILGYKAAQKPLLACLSASSPQVRAAAVEALGALGDAEVLPQVLEQLDDLNMIVRAAACTALGHLAVPEAIEPLRAAVDDPASYVRQAALATIPKLPPEGIAIAHAGLKLRDTEEQLAAIAGLAAMATMGALDALVEVFGKAHGAVRQAAKEALVAADWHPVGLRGKRLDPGLRRWYRCSEWLGEDVQKRPNQIGAMTLGLKEDNPVRRRAAAETLGLLGDSSAVKALQAVVNDPDVDVQAVVTEALVCLGEAPGKGAGWTTYAVCSHDWAKVEALGESALPALYAESAHPQPEIRREVLAQAAKIGSKAALLGAHLWDDPEEDIRDQARNLCCSADPADWTDQLLAWPPKKLFALIDSLKNSVSNDPIPEHRALATKLLTTVGGAEIEPYLLALADGADAPVHRALLTSLKGRSVAPTQNQLESLLSHSPDNTVRVLAAETLAELHGKDAASAIGRLLVMDSPELPGQAEALLKKLLGKAYDRDKLELEQLVELERWDDLVARGDKAVPQLAATLSPPEQNKASAQRRVLAAQALANIGSKSALQPLEGLRQDSDQRIRSLVNDALGDPPTAGDA